MEEIDKKLDHWIHSGIIRAEIRKVIENHILNEKTAAYKAGWTKCELNNEEIRINKLSYE